MNQPPYNTDLVNSDFHLLELLKVHLGGYKFQTDDELKCCVLNWLQSQDKSLYVAHINNLPG
jgi:hypothetical protein